MISHAKTMGNDFRKLFLIIYLCVFWPLFYSLSIRFELNFSLHETSFLHFVTFCLEVQILLTIIIILVNNGS